MYKQLKGYSKLNWNIPFLDPIFLFINPTFQILDEGLIKMYGNVVKVLTVSNAQYDTNIGTEELAHMEMICAIVYQLTKDVSVEELERSV